MFSVGRKLNRILLVALMAFVSSFFFISASQAGKMAPGLEKQLANLGDNDEINVIVEMVEQADLSAKPGKPARLRELQSVASKSQSKVLAKLAKDKQEGKVNKYKGFWIFNGLAVTATKAEIQELVALENVKEVRTDTTYQIPPNLQEKVEQAEWNIDKVRAPEVWQNFGLKGKGIVVANMDTGVYASHADLQEQYRGGPNSWHDSVNGQPTPYDDYGHGTHTMGTICGRDKGGTAIGVAPDATWIATKAFDAGGWGLSSWIHDSFQWLADPDGNPDTDDAPNVVNNSWGNDYGLDTEFRPDVQHLNNLGIFTVFSNGNAGPSPGTVGAPASYSFGVGATDINDEIAWFSSRGPSPIDGSIKPNVSAPGVSVWSSVPWGYTWGDGTSMAAPHVTGTIALLLEANPSLSLDQIATTLQDTAVDLGAGGPDNDYGWGRIDAYKAVSMVAHTGVLAGTVKDAETGAPLSATVTILEIGASANTDAATGWYSLTAPAGDYTAEAEALSYPPQTATVTIIEGRTVIQDFALSLVDPEIEVSTTSISMTLISGEKASSEFTISNVGPIGSGLRFNIQEGLLAQNFPWISEKPTSSTVDGGSSQKVEALFDTTGLFRGIYEVDLLISSNDRDNPLVTVNVELTVLEPDIAVAPDKFDVKVEYNTTHEKTMTIMNNGDGMLRFNIVDESVSTPKAVASTHATDSLSPDKYPKMYPNRAPLGPNHAPIPPLESPMASVIPTLDGTYSPGEWDDSAIVSVTPIIDPEGAEVGKLYVKNSAANLYVLIDQHTQSGTSVDITGDMWFDLDNNGSNDGGLYTEVYFGYVYSYFDYPARVEVGESATPSNPSPHWIFEYEIPLSGIGMSVGSLFGIHFILYNYFDYVQAGEWYNYSGDFDYYYPDRWADIRLSDWLTESPTAGTLNPGESISITLTFDANGLRNGDYLANVLVRNNDPDMPTAIVPARMEVYNAPQAIISVTPESFDKTIDGWTAITDTMTISNLGSIPLEFSIRDKTGWLSETPTWGQVEPGNSIAVTVNFDSNGLEDGDYYDSIIINSNDFDRPEVVVPAHIKVINAPKPDIDVSPLSFDETLPKGYKITRTMTIKNTADVAPLKFNITDALPMKMTGNLPKIENNQPFSVVDGNYPKTEAREKIDGPPVIAGSGGPDAFGYRWIDSDEPGGPVFDWLDIRDIGTRIEPLGDDWNVGPFDIGFDFPFYGNKFDKFQFCTNGFISFTSYSAQFWPTPLPSWDAPENLVAPFLTDFEFFSGGEAYYWSNGVDTLVVEYYNVPHLAFGGSYTFEVILRSNGSITYQYKQIEGPTDWATVGIQNADRTIGLQVAYNTPYIHDNLAIMIASEVLWLDEEPSSGVLLPGESVDIAVTFNTTELSIGDYVAEIIISSNDPDENPWVAPVSLKVREVLLSLAPSQKEVAKGDVFTVEMQLDTQGIKINGASAYLSFEDTFLQAVGAPSGKGGPFTPGTFIGGTVLDNDSHGDPGNNLPGLQMDYSEGITDKTISGKGTLASFRLNATKLPADSGATVPINFDFDPQNQRDTVVSLPEGFVIKPAISKPAATIIINKNAALTTWGISGKALLQGRQKHNANITFELRMSGGKEPILVRQAVTNTDGAFTIDKIPGGTYDLTAKEFHYLRAISKPITIPPSATNVTFDSKLPGSPQNALRAGECNDDNAVNLNDLSILALFFGKSATPPKEIPKPEEPPTPWHADIDGNGIVDMSDFTLLASNFGQQGVPGGLLAAPAEQLLAGINSNATFRMQPSTGHRSVDGTYGVPLGEAFELQIIAESATDLRGYSLELEYDSAAIQLINDTNGVASEGVFLRRTKSENSTLFFSQIRNEEAASQMQNITIASSTTGSYSSVSGNGAVASLRFRVLKKQPGAISMSNLLVVDSRGNLNRLSDSTALIKAIPRKSRLAQNYPNPFNPDTWIPFELAEEAPVLIRIYNVNGQLVKTLALGLKAPGFYVDKQQAAYWNGRNEISEKVASGVYFYVMEAGKFRTARKMVILK